MKRIQRFPAALFAAAALAFLLPFGTVSCDGEQVSFSGAELAAWQVEPDSGTLHEQVEDDASLFASAALLAVVAGLALSLLGRRGAGVCAALGLVAMQLILGSALWSLADVRIEGGYWLSVLALTAAGVERLVARVRERRAQGSPIWPSYLVAGLTATPTVLLVLVVGVALSES